MVRPAIGVVLLLAIVAPARGQVYPSAPQSANGVNQDTVEAGTTAGQELGNVYVPFGKTGYIDPQPWGYCRTVSNTGTASGGRTGAIVHTHTAAEWLSFRTNPGTVLSEAVCCRPQAVSLCRGAAGGTVTETLPYTSFGGQQTPVASCTDAWGAAYTDSQTWTCGQTTTGVTADGQWSQAGGDRYGCTANAYTSGCTASCGGGTTTTYDSCGNVQWTNACNTQSCCTPNWQLSGSCTGPGSVPYVDLNNCGTSYGQPPPHICQEVNVYFGCAGYDYKDCGCDCVESVGGSTCNLLNTTSYCWEQWPWYTTGPLDSHGCNTAYGDGVCTTYQ